jgi:seryl-tRNA synthetase
MTEMANTNYLEQKLGELTGELRALVPALEKVEDRLLKLEEKTVQTETRLQALRTEYDEFRKKVSTHMGRHYTKMEGLISENGKRDAELEALKKTVAGASKKVWEVVKIVVLPALAAVLTWYFTGRK